MKSMKSSKSKFNLFIFIKLTLKKIVFSYKSAIDDIKCHIDTNAIRNLQGVVPQLAIVPATLIDLAELGKRSR